MNIINLFFKSSLLIKFIIFVLIIFSVISWAIFIQKICMLHFAFKKSKFFEKKFWSNIELTNLYKESQRKSSIIVGSEQIFYSGFKEFTSLKKYNSSKLEIIVEGAIRAMRISMNRELEILETHIPFLGTISSTSPYIGLFGTIWGIMHSFMKLDIIKQETLQIIAPSIAESLITTAIGLFTAIPAVIIFNYLNQYMNKLEINYNNFIEEFTAILYRETFAYNNKRK